MLISELAKMVHENAVEHGWWDDDREPPKIIALIHSEWSEALEEARAGRPLVWYFCNDCADGSCNAAPDNVAYACGFDKAGRKPEGVAVELIDGCIRILDYLGHLGTVFKDKDDTETVFESLYSDSNMNKVPNNVTHVIALLHLYTSTAFMSQNNALIPINVFGLVEALAAALSWVKKQGLAPLAILLEKHAYNKTRPYKHGKKF